ncbi:FMN-binding glutamate synthase family protein [Verrucomicrobiales bacterium]|nr:FMN-binding glutamate synthase family protein [Verrucomicrobiales bacterium]
MVRNAFFIIAPLSLALAIALGIWYPLYGCIALLIVLPVVLLGYYDAFQKHHSILRNYPILGHFRYILESISPELQQYFIERHTDGTPIPRNHRAIVYERSKDLSSTHPFGTELDLNQSRYEGFKHSIYPAPLLETPPRVKVGGKDCKKPYEASIYNISAMSFGALSKNAIMAMNGGAQLGGFYHNTGEGGLTKYHLEPGGDVVWQIGTGYFGCRTKEGGFDPDKFAEKAKHEQVKMIELKVSQGAKPGHGGVLPGEKNTEEIAAIRGVEPHTTVLSPPGHREFSDPEGLLKFLGRMRELSGGKPVGFKLCIGREEEFVAICDAMKSSGIAPDFITVDGAEGGTGAAPLEFSDSVGMPLEPALGFVDRTLREHGLRSEIRIIASGKMVTAASILKVLAQGADFCNGARAFMMAVGCIQALRCDTNQCPTGIATQNPSLMKAVVVDEKKKRVANFHRNTVEAVLELMAACGAAKLDDLNPSMIIYGSDWHSEGSESSGSSASLLGKPRN